MSAETIEQNILYALGLSADVADATHLAYALRWANAAYRQMLVKHDFASLNVKTNFPLADGQQTYTAPSDFNGIGMLKDETHNEPLDPETLEQFQRNISISEIIDEVFESADDTAVALEHKSIVQYSDFIYDDTDHTTLYTRDTDYAISYTGGTVTVDCDESMSDETDYYISYLYHAEGPPSHFCIEYDSTNKLFLFRLRPTPNEAMRATLIYPAFPSALSSSVNPIWDKFEYCLERGGIYFGSLEMLMANDPRIDRYEKLYMDALRDLVNFDARLLPKSSTIPVIMKKRDLN